MVHKNGCGAAPAHFLIIESSAGVNGRRHIACDASGAPMATAFSACTCGAASQRTAIMESRLTEQERTICERMRISPDEYLPAKRTRLGAFSTHPRKRSVVDGLTEEDRAVLAHFSGVTPAQFLAAKRARQNGASGVATMAQSKLRGMNGPGIAQAAFYEHREEMDQAGADAASLTNEAQAAIASYQAAPDEPNSWQLLARAAGFLIGALDLIAPPYANRDDYKNESGVQ